MNVAGLRAASLIAAMARMPPLARNPGRLRIIGNVKQMVTHHEDLNLSLWILHEFS